MGIRSGSTSARDEATMRLAVLLAALTVAGLGAVAILSWRGDDSAAAGTLALDPACGAVSFDHYDAGAEVAGFKKTDTSRQCERDTAAPTGIDMLVTVYGSCEPVGSDGDCAPPV